MSIVGIGTDIVSIKRIEKVLSKQSDKFLKRVLTENELKQLPEGVKARVYFVSKRWAAKEAVSKAFSTGIGDSLSFQDIDIQHEPSGAPIVVLSERAQRLSASKGITNIHISLSDENKYAVAFVVAER